MEKQCYTAAFVKQLDVVGLTYMSEQQPDTFYAGHH